MIQFEYTEWKDTLTKYKAEMEKELAAVRAAKQELAEMQRQLQEMIGKGRYERDEDTLILSAPNIIIGNVDKFGNLISGGSNITIRGNNVALEGVGFVTGSSVSGGSVTTRARNVSVQTVDPGIDGMESVAFPDSSFSVQTAAIGLSAESIEPSESGGVFTQSAQSVMGCINFAADTNINISAASAIENNELSEVVSDLEKESKNYGKSIDNAIKVVDSSCQSLDKNQNNALLDLLGAASEEADIMSLRIGDYEFQDRSLITQSLTNTIAKNVHSGAVSMALMAESNRVAKYLKTYSQNLSEKTSKFEKEATGSSVTINSESIKMASIGADGKVRTSPGNGIKFLSQNYMFSTIEGLKPIENSTFKVVANDINFDASDYTFEKKDDAMMLTKSEAKGSIKLNAGVVEITGQDRTFEKEGEDVKMTPAITPESQIYINIGDVLINQADAEGKAQGNFIANTKNIILCSCDVDKEDTSKPTGAAEGGTITIGAKNVFLGTALADMPADSVQVAAKTVSLLGDEKVNLQKADDSSHLLLDANAELSGGNVNVIGKITLGGQTEVADKLKAGDVEVANLKASSSVTGPNLKDGMPVPAAAAPAQAGKGAELKSVEAPQVKHKTAKKE